VPVWRLCLCCLFCWNTRTEVPITRTVLWYISWCIVSSVICDCNWVWCEIQSVYNRIIVEFAVEIAIAVAIVVG